MFPSARRRFCLITLVAALRFMLPAPASGQMVAKQAMKTPWSDEVGNLVSRYDQAAWPAPEALLQDLRSPQDETRLQALQLVGLTDQQAHHAVWGQAQTTPPKVIGQIIAIPDQIQLLYAVLGGDGIQQAIIAVQDGQMNYAAVGVPTPKGWKRVAAFDCWCKYDGPLDEFVQLRAGSMGPPASFELVLRASGGGSGLYSQEEAHFRVRQGELRRVLSFESRRRHSNAGFTGACKQPNASIECVSLAESWFIFPAQIANSPDYKFVGGVLLEAHGEFDPANTARQYSAASWELLRRQYMQVFTCRAYRWNQQQFRYIPSRSTISCANVM